MVFFPMRAVVWFFKPSCSYCGRSVGDGFIVVLFSLVMLFWLQWLDYKSEHFHSFFFRDGFFVHDIVFAPHFSCFIHLIFAFVMQPANSPKIFAHLLIYQPVHLPSCITNLIIASVQHLYLHNSATPQQIIPQTHDKHQTPDSNTTGWNDSTTARNQRTLHQQCFAAHTRLSTNCLTLMEPYVWL